MKIKAKIIGNQIWSAENLTRRQYIKLTGLALPIENGIGWEMPDEDELTPRCCTYSLAQDKKEYYLFDQHAVLCLNNATKSLHWRVPTMHDWNQLFDHIHAHSGEGLRIDTICNGLRGNYGWKVNGTNQFGFNAFPNPHRCEDGSYSHGGAQWWTISDFDYIGLGLYQDLNVIAESGSDHTSAMPIRLVLDLPEIRLHRDILYI